MNNEEIRLKRARLMRRMSEEVNYIECATKVITSASDKIKLIQEKLEGLK